MLLLYLPVDHMPSKAQTKPEGRRARAPKRPGTKPGSRRKLTLRQRAVRNAERLRARTARRKQSRRRRKPIHSQRQSPARRSVPARRHSDQRFQRINHARYFEPELVYHVIVRTKYGQFFLRPDEEGELTRIRAVLVREKWLATAAGRLGLGDFLLLGRGEEKMGGRLKPSILSGAVEAVAGAVFLDGGWEAAYDLVTLLFRDAPASGELQGRTGDAKTGLQELCQKHCQLEPHYRLLSQSGPAHRPCFKVAAFLGEKLLAEGRGASKQKAEQDAAASAIDLIESTGGLQHPGERREEDD